MTTSQVYWLTRLDSLNTALTIGFVGGIILLCTVAFFGSMYADMATDTAEEERTVKKTVWRTVRTLGVIAVLSGVASIFVPTTKELVAIYGISYLTQNKDAREIPETALKVLNQQLKEMAGEEKEEK